MSAAEVNDRDDRSAPIPVVLDVDTGTDDAGALLLAATFPSLELVAALATWGNCGRDQAARNTLVILEAAGRPDVPVHLGGVGPSGPAPVRRGADVVMGSDGLGDAGLADPVGTPDPEAAAEALVRLAAEAPGQLTLVALAPLTTIAAALALDPELPGRLHHLVVMGGAVSVGGNATPAAEANVGHDPIAAARVVSAFGAPGRLVSGRRPYLVPLDVTLRSPLTIDELRVLAGSPVAGAGLLHKVWQTIWPTGLLETGREGVWPAHDLLATWCVVDPTLCQWVTAPLLVDTGGSAAWGATVVDRRAAGAADAGGGGLWDIAMRVDAERYRAAVRDWLSGVR
jgi:purine nucleosidase